MLPSVKRLEAAFPGKGKALRALLESEKAVRLNSAAIEHDRRCYHAPSLSALRMIALDDVAKTYGVEAFQDKRGRWIEYVNVGKLYTPTIVCFPDGRYRVACVGDVIERRCSLLDD